jgi:AraC-like DNA-binding protein
MFKMFEFRIYYKDKDVKIFVQKGFFRQGLTTTTLHRHYYPEIHLVEQGNVEYLVNDKRISMHPGDMLAIPADTFHRCYQTCEPVNIIAFQVDYPILSCVVKKSIPGFLSTFKSEIENAHAKGICGKIPAYLTLICGEIFEENENKLMFVQDRKFIVHEFFQQNYDRDVALSDLAKELNLSEKQTERLVKEYTGNTFRQEISYRKIQAAKHLLAAEDITLSEAAGQVGYQSYSGFWKAFTKK